jgi:site-specific DNA-methyltransferase (adenine-specific)
VTLAPYWQSNDGGIRVYHGDMRELCRDLRADAIITDAPFGIGNKPLGARKAGRRWAGVKLKSTAYHASSTWDADIDPAWCAAACEAAPVVAWFGSWKRRGAVEALMPHAIRCEIIWAKDVHVGPPTPAAMRDERIWIFSAKTFRGQHFETTVWDEAIVPTWEHRWHANQKPERLMGRLIRWVAPPAWTIGDPFMGSGTTLLAAQRLGRRAWGIDSDEEHCKNAVARLGGGRTIEAAGPLFDRR